jgi:hypothetical protein
MAFSSSGPGRTGIDPTAPGFAQKAGPGAVLAAGHDAVTYLADVIQMHYTRR